MFACFCILYFVLCLRVLVFVSFCVLYLRVFACVVFACVEVLFFILKGVSKLIGAPSFHQNCC